MRFQLSAAALVLALVSPLGAQPPIEFVEETGQIAIRAGGKPLATYVYQDKQIPRPFLANVFLPGGPKVTRNHPPIPGKDDLDHGTGSEYYHPGLWLAFADLNGNDYWRLKADVRHEELVERPSGTAGKVSFVVRNSYRRAGMPEQVVAQQLCRYTVVQLPAGWLLVCDSAIWSPDGDLVFGDQEEMGCGLRMARPLAVKHGGRMIDNAGRVNEKEIWSHEGVWCDYSGTIDGRPVGVLLIADPGNKYSSRFHARDYGLLAANPFGGQVFGDKEPRKSVVPRGELLRLRFAVLVHEGANGTRADLQRTFDEVLKVMNALPRPRP